MKYIPISCFLPMTMLTALPQQGSAEIYVRDGLNNPVAREQTATPAMPWSEPDSLFQVPCARKSEVEARLQKLKVRPHPKPSSRRFRTGPQIWLEGRRPRYIKPKSYIKK